MVVLPPPLTISFFREFIQHVYLDFISHGLRDIHLFSCSMDESFL